METHILQAKKGMRASKQGKVEEKEEEEEKKKGEPKEEANKRWMHGVGWVEVVQGAHEM